MDTKTINNLIKELDDKITYYAENENLFCGGCCFSAYLLAKGLEKLGIKYSVIMYQNGDNWNTNKFDKVCAGNGCGHVAICTVYKHKKMILGFNEYIDNLLEMGLNMTGVWMKREYRTIKSVNLYRTYYTNMWNWRWDIRKNTKLKKEINAIFEKYM